MQKLVSAAIGRQLMFGLRFRLSEFIMQGGKIYSKIQANKVLDQKSSVIFFANPEDRKVKLGEVVQVDNKYTALILSISSRISSAILLDHVSGPGLSAVQLSADEKNRVPLTIPYRPECLACSISDYRGRPLLSSAKSPVSGDTSQILLPVYEQNKAILPRKKVHAQIFTGNIQIDLTQQLAQGHLTLFQGAPNCGQSDLALNTMAQFARNVARCIHSQEGAGKSRHVVFCTLNWRAAEKTHALLSSKQAKNFSIITVDRSCPEDLSQKYFAPFSALALANHLKKDNDVLLVFDGVMDHFSVEQQLFSILNLPFGNHNILYELFTSTGQFEGGSLTTVLDIDDTKLSSNEMILYANKAHDLSDNIINFDGSEVPLLRIKTKIKHNHVLNQPYVNKLITRLQQRVVQVFQKLKYQTRQIKLKNELNIHIDPWDFYLYHDSKYFIQLFYNDFVLEPVQLIVYMHVLLKCIDEEVTSQFKLLPKQLIEYFLKFANEFKEFEKRNIFEYSQLMLERMRQEPDQTLEANLHQCYERLYELFLMQLKINDHLLPQKKDYFN